MLDNHLPRWLLRAVGVPGAASLRRWRGPIEQSRTWAASAHSLSDDDLAELATARGRNATYSDADRARVIGAVVEVARRQIGLEATPEQIEACWGLVTGHAIEMDAGEGKTLVGALAATVQALTGRSVHVMSVNDYLAQRDCEWMGPIFEAVGVGATWIGQHTPVDRRRAAYQSDVVYAPISEIGYDVLRDGFVRSVEEESAPRFDVGIVDEADAVMIDDATSPLVLAGDSSEDLLDFSVATSIVSSLDADRDFEVDSDQLTVTLTDHGIDEVERQLGGISLFDAQNTGLHTRINVALHARVLVHRDVDYLVENGTVRLINTSRGRVALRHRWPDGLHAAIEAKEGLAGSEPGLVLDMITIHELLLRYQHLSGMSGTILSVADQLDEFYQLRSTRIDCHRPRIRNDEPIQVFVTQEEKEAAILEEITARTAKGQPVLVGTQSLAESERIAALLEPTVPGVRVLNARNDAQEAAIVARAGEYKAVTVSTQMSGRGTDIRLGGASEEDRDRVAATGGLAVIATSVYPTRRLDAQLRGRSGRQGDPGVSITFAALDDEIVQTNAPDYQLERIEQYGDRLGDADRAEIVGAAQDVAESVVLNHHRSTWQYNQAISRQRRTSLDQRRQALTTDAAITMLREALPDQCAELSESCGQAKTDQALRAIYVSCLDDEWTRHLAVVGEIRDGIYLRALGGQNPVEEFHLLALREFDGFFDRVRERAIAESGGIDPTNIDSSINRLELRRPSATWTYMINDNPFGAAVDRAIRTARRVVRRLAGD